MSGVSYQPPTNILRSFNTNEFTNTSSTLSVASANKLYVQYPISQGSITINGTLTISSPLVLPTTYSSIGSSALGYKITGLTTNTASITSSATFTNLSNITLSPGVWIINWNTIFTSPIGVINIGTSNANNTITYSNSTQSTTIGLTMNSSGCQTVYLTSSTTYYLNINSSTYTSGTLSVSAGNYSFIGTRIG